MILILIFAEALALYGLIGEWCQGFGSVCAALAVQLSRAPFERVRCRSLLN
jgi:hypothetical protein